MIFDKDHYYLHCKIKLSTAEILRTQSEAVGISVGETVDFMVKWYMDYCNAGEVEEEKAEINDTLSKILDKVEKIEKKVGVTSDTDRVS